MFDKTIFEAIACGALPLSSSADMAELAGTTYVFTDGDAEDLARVLRQALALSEQDREKEVSRLRAAIIHMHSLPTLADSLVREMA